MKKMISVSLVILGCMFLCLCSEMSMLLANGAVIVESSDTADMSRTTENKELFTRGNLKMYVHMDGLMNSRYAVSENGCYELAINNDWSANILYTDIAAKQRKYLSSGLSADQHSDTDTSQIEDVRGGGFLFTVEDNLYIETVGYEDIPGALYRADLNGENRVKITTFDNFSPFSEAIVSDGNFLYTLTSDNGITKSVVRVNPENGYIEKIYELSEYNAFLVSAYGDTMIIKTIQIPASGQYNDNIQFYKNQEHILYKYTLGTGTIEELMRWKQDSVFETYEEDMMYFFDVSDDTLKCMNLENGEINVIIPDVKDQGIAVGNFGVLQPVWDQHLIFDDFDGNRWNIDLDTLEIKQQKYDEQLSGYPGIIGEYDDHFLISIDDFNTYGIPDLALIDKENYWDSNYEIEQMRNTFYNES